MSPARVTDFVSRVIEKNGLSVDSHQYMARFVYQVQRKFCVQLQTGKKPMKRAPAKMSECKVPPSRRQTRPRPVNYVFVFPLRDLFRVCTLFFPMMIVNRSFFIL